ncbi:MAG TPA: hypothetical protein VIH18_15825 [Candidatus Binatia bacterium]|jgi:hypothetical protein
MKSDSQGRSTDRRCAVDKIYSDFIGAKSSYRELLNSRKKMIMLASLASEINTLSPRLDDIPERNCGGNPVFMDSGSRSRSRAWPE